MRVGSIDHEDGRHLGRRTLNRQVERPKLCIEPPRYGALLCVGVLRALPQVLIHDRLKAMSEFAKKGGLDVSERWQQRGDVVIRR
jgi:hypothetical protein